MILHDSTRINQISYPGTHDTMANEKINNLVGMYCHKSIYVDISRGNIYIYLFICIETNYIST